MPAFSRSRGMLGPGFGKPVNELRPLHLSPAPGKLYAPTDPATYKRTGPYTMNEELLQGMRERRHQSAPATPSTPITPAERFQGPASRMPEPSRPVRLAGRVSPSSILEHFHGPLHRPVPHRPPPSIVRPAPLLQLGSSPRSQQVPSRPASGTWSRSARFNASGDMRARIEESQRSQRLENYVTLRRMGISPRGGGAATPSCTSPRAAPTSTSTPRPARAASAAAAARPPSPPLRQSPLQSPRSPPPLPPPVREAHIPPSVMDAPSFVRDSIAPVLPRPSWRPPSPRLAFY